MFDNPLQRQTFTSKLPEIQNIYNITLFNFKRKYKIVRTP